jgi:hypothetical protein
VEFKINDMTTLDNMNGTETIYWIVDVKPTYGQIEVGQVVSDEFAFVEYTNRAAWIADMDTLGIEHEETL